MLRAHRLHCSKNSQRGFPGAPACEPLPTLKGSEVSGPCFVGGS